MLFVRKISLAVILFLTLSFQKPQPISSIPLTTLKNQTTTFPFSANAKATVIYFLSPECPLCQSYTLTINNLATAYKSKGIAFIGIVPGKEHSLSTILNYKRSYKLNLTILVDEQLKLTKQLGATITPEVIVLSTQKQILYKGRIDNWAYELGRKRKVITDHNLKDAIEAILHHQPIKTTQTKAVGCFIE